MEQLLSALLSGRLVYMVLVPLLRALAAGLLAWAIAKDCTARRNGSTVLWALLAFLSPLICGTVYFIYSRFWVERKPESAQDRRLDKSAKKLVVWSAAVYVIACVIAIVAVITMIASGIAIIGSEDFPVSVMPLYK